MAKSLRQQLPQIMMWVGLGLGLPIWVHSLIDALRYPYGLKGIVAAVKEAEMSVKFLSDGEALSIWAGFTLIPAILATIGAWLHYRAKKRLKAPANVDAS